MRKILSITLILIIPVLICANAILGNQGQRPSYANNIVKVQLSKEADSITNLSKSYRSLSPSFGIDKLDELVASWGEHQITRAHISMVDRAYEEEVGFDRWILLEFKEPIDVLEAVKILKEQKRWVDDAHPEYIRYPAVVPNDPWNTSNWGHNNTGSNGPGSGTAGFDSKAYLAWDQPQGYGSANIIIAIIDSGVDTAHPDLRLMAGYDYGDNDSNPMDDSGGGTNSPKGHGTACAGIAAGIANNGIGVSGIAGGCTVMPLKAADSNGYLYDSYIINAITHARNNGAHIISLSLGGSGQIRSAPAFDNALTAAYNAGITIFAATGNENASSILYPANHNRVIAVGAASPSGQRKSPSSSDGQSWWGSNYGVNTQDNTKAVDIMAATILPTTDITGSGGYATGDYMTGFNGTSCATPYAAGVGALVKSRNPSLTPAEIRDILTSTATDMTYDGGVGWDRYTGYGMVNAYQAVLAAAPIPEIQINVTSLDYGYLPVNESLTRSFTISNTGTGILTGSISTPLGYTVSLFQSKSMSEPSHRGDRNVLSYSVGEGQSKTFDLKLEPSTAGTYNGNVEISHNAGGNDKTIAVTGTALLPFTIPSAEGFEDDLGEFVLVNGTQTNKWARGTATANTGDYALYISNNSGVSNAYTITSTSVVHAWQFIQVPNDGNDWLLRFAWKSRGDGSNDYLSVYLLDKDARPVAGTALSSGQLGGAYQSQQDWKTETITLPASAYGQTKVLVFSWRNNNITGTQPPAAIDDIRIVPGENSDAAVVIDDEVNLDLPPVTDSSSNVISPSLQITDVTQSDGFALVKVGYDSVGSGFLNAGLDFTITNVDTRGCTMNFTHNLDFIPYELVYRLGDSPNWMQENNPGDWTTTHAYFTVPSAKAHGDLEVIFPKNSGGTVPVVLSSFTAAISADNFVNLNWVTQTETDVLGFYVLRNDSDDLSSAITVSPLVQATNTSSQQSYIFTDRELFQEGTYYYWLQNSDLDGSVGFHGPASIAYSSLNVGTPEIPLVTELAPVYPNPFNPVAHIPYSLKDAAAVTFEIYNVRGQVLRHINAGEKGPGKYQALWDGRDDNGRECSTGIYYVRMTAGDYVQSRKMILCK